jgi:hypothetical protein
MVGVTRCRKINGNKQKNILKNERGVGLLHKKEWEQDMQGSAVQWKQDS